MNTCSNIIGLKDSSGSLDKLQESAAYRNGTFNTAVGSDALILAGLSAGFDACVSGNANVVPELVVALHQAVATGELDRAKTLQTKLVSFQKPRDRSTG